MQYGAATVEKLINGRKHVIRVSVAVERPSSTSPSYIRYGNGISDNDSAVSIGAHDGARFAKWKVDPRHYGIEIREISGDLESKEAMNGAAVASAIATWIAYGVDWDDADLEENWGWSLRRPVGEPGRS